MTEQSGATSQSAWPTGRQVLVCSVKENMKGRQIFEKERERKEGRKKDKMKKKKREGKKMKRAGVKGGKRKESDNSFPKQQYATYFGHLLLVYAAWKR